MVFAMLVCATAGQACILPPPIDEESPAQNRPPTIDPVRPTRDGEPVKLDCSGQSLLFLATIADDNLRDTLYYRFFIDYFRLDPADILDITPVRAPPLPNGRSRSASTDISANNPILLERPTDVHVVELLVADREFDDSNPDIDPNAVGRSVVEGGLSASYTWAVNPIECN
jgi:hypothetical protein